MFFFFCFFLGGCSSEAKHLRLWLAALTQRGTFGVLLSAEPHAGSNERRAGEAVFFNPAQGLVEQRSPLSSRCQVQLSTAPRSIVAHFYFPTTTAVSVSLALVPLPASVLTIHLDSSTTASYYEPRSNNL